MAALLLAGCAARPPAATVATKPAATKPAATKPVVPREQVPPNAAKPPLPAPDKAAVSPAARSADIIGLGTEAVEKLLGEPEMVRRDAPAEVWQYRSEACVVDLYLYPAQASYRVAYIEARDPSAASVAADNCFQSLAPRQPAI